MWGHWVNLELKKFRLQKYSPNEGGKKVSVVLGPLKVPTDSGLMRKTNAILKQVQVEFIFESKEILDWSFFFWSNPKICESSRLSKS